jgi:hypothetical protein
MKSCTRVCDTAVRYALALALPAMAFFGFGPKASAQDFDLFQTGSGAYVDLSSMGYGTVNLQGVPIQSSTGNTDTMIYRTPTSSGYSATIYALYMVSTSPVTYKGQSADIYITVNNTGITNNPAPLPQTVLPQPDSLTQQTGSVTITSSSTFNSSVPVNADVIFVPHGTSPTNSANILGSSAAPSITLSTTNSTYSSTPPSGYPGSSSSPSSYASSSSGYPSGGFYPKPNHTGPHPVVPAYKCTTSPSPSASSVKPDATNCIVSAQ